MFRVIRVLKAIGKFEALQVVASSVSKSVSGVGATAIFILITVSMYAIIGVQMFGLKAPGPSDVYGDLTDTAYVDMHWETRNNYYNANCEEVPLWQYFGNLRRSMLTMFVFTTVEGWPDLGWCLGKTYSFGSLFCCTFIIITALLMANIVVAIFTNKMEEAQEEVEAEQRKFAAKRKLERDRSVRMLTQRMGENATILGIDTDGDGIVDTYEIDADGDGVADGVMSAEEMAANQQSAGIEMTGVSGGGNNLEKMLKRMQEQLNSITKRVDTLVKNKGRRE